MDKWASNIPQALYRNVEITKWINELRDYEKSIDEERDSLNDEFATFDNLYHDKFCKKCMPELDQIIYEALFSIFPDFGCQCK